MIDRYNLYFMASSSNVLLPLPFSVDGRMDAALIVMVGNKIACAMIPLRLDINRGVSMTQAQATYDERAQIFLQSPISLRNTAMKMADCTKRQKDEKFCAIMRRSGKYGRCTGHLHFKRASTGGKTVQYY